MSIRRERVERVCQSSESSYRLLNDNHCIASSWLASTQEQQGVSIVVFTVLDMPSYEKGSREEA